VARGRAIDIPIEALPPIDEHGVEIDASPDAVWEALLKALPAAFGSRLSSRTARMLGCVECKIEGEPGRIGSTLPGFVVARAIPPATLALEGEHRYSRYALVFRIDRLPSGGSRLRAETRAEFPGARGRAYRALVIGTRGHVLVVRRLLRAVRRRAESG
jgi:hypothetical protein